MIYMHAVVAAFRIYAQMVKMQCWKGGLESMELHGWSWKSWKNHGIVFLNFCGNPDITVSSFCTQCKSYFTKFFLKKWQDFFLQIQEDIQRIFDFTVLLWESKEDGLFILRTLSSGE